MPVFQLFQQIVSLFIIMGLGFLMVKLKLLKSSDSKILSILSIYIICPIVNINAFQIAYTKEILQGFLIACAVSVVIHIILIIVCTLLKVIFHMTEVERLSAIYSNAGNLVIPLVSALFGPEWVIYASAFMSVQVICQWTHAQSVMSGQTKFNFKKIITNVNMIAVFVGLILFIFKVKLPGLIQSTFSGISALLGPITMIMIGMMIGGTDLKKVVKNKRIYIVAALRLLLIPLIGIGIVKLVGHFIDFENEKIIFSIVMLALITPSAATETQLAQFYNNEPEYASSINVLTTLLCIGTMPLLSMLF